jgi:hypothetical protein
MQTLQLHLTRGTRSWLRKIPSGSIDSWNELARQFVSNFLHIYIQAAYVNRRTQSLHPKTQRFTSLLHPMLEHQIEPKISPTSGQSTLLLLGSAVQNSSRR